MKTLFIFLVTLFLNTIVFSQNNCKRTTSLKGGMYKMEGTASIIETSDKLQFLLEENFKTQEGPDVTLFLSKMPDYNPEMIEFGKLKVFAGQMDFSINKNNVSDWKEYPYVVFLCVQAGNLLWGNGILGDISGNCDALGFEHDLKADEPLLQGNGIVFSLIGEKIFEGDLTQFNLLSTHLASQLLLIHKEGKITKLYRKL